MTDRQQRLHWLVSHAADLLLIALLVGLLLYLAAG